MYSEILFSAFDPNLTTRARTFHFNRNVQRVITGSARNVSKFVFNRQTSNLRQQTKKQETHASSGVCITRSACKGFD